MVLKQSLELGVLAGSSQEKDVQNPRQKGKVKGRGRGPRQFGEAFMMFFTWWELWGTGIQNVFEVPLWGRDQIFFPCHKLGHDFGVRYVHDWPFGMGTTPGMGYDHHSTGISMVLGKWIC